MTCQDCGKGDAVNAYKVGDRVFRWWDSGAFGAQLQPLTIVRVNRVTVTVRTDHGSTFRMPPGLIAGRWDG